MHPALEERVVLGVEELDPRALALEDARASRRMSAQRSASSSRPSSCATNSSSYSGSAKFAVFGPPLFELRHLPPEQEEEVLRIGIVGDPAPHEDLVGAVAAPCPGTCCRWWRRSRRRGRAGATRSRRTGSAGARRARACPPTSKVSAQRLPGLRVDAVRDSRPRASSVCARSRSTLAERVLVALVVAEDARAASATAPASRGRSGRAREYSCESIDEAHRLAQLAAALAAGAPTTRVVHVEADVVDRRRRRTCRAACRAPAISGESAPLVHHLVEALLRRCPTRRSSPGGTC